MENENRVENRFSIVDEEGFTLFRVELVWPHDEEDAEKQMKSIVQALNKSNMFPGRVYYS
jgi:ATP-dependent RNA circularization protein (DNA/RNA ligase family)